MFRSKPSHVSYLLSFFTPLFTRFVLHSDKQTNYTVVTKSSANLHFINKCIFTVFHIFSLTSSVFSATLSSVCL